MTPVPCDGLVKKRVGGAAHKEEGDISSSKNPERSLIGAGGKLLGLKGVHTCEAAALRVKLTGLCVQGEMEKKLEDSKLRCIRLYSGPSWSTKTSLWAVRALQLACFLKGGRAEGGGLRLYSVQTTSCSSLVLRSQPIQFTYIWLPLSKCIHWITQSGIRFTTLQ